MFPCKEIVDARPKVEPGRGSRRSQLMRHFADEEACCSARHRLGGRGGRVGDDADPDGEAPRGGTGTLAAGDASTGRVARFPTDTNALAGERSLSDLARTVGTGLAAKTVGTSAEEGKRSQDNGGFSPARADARFPRSDVDRE